MFAKKEKAETSTLLTNLISMKYKRKMKHKRVHHGDVSSYFKNKGTQVKAVGELTHALSFDISSYTIQSI